MTPLHKQTIEEKDMWCDKCGNHVLEVSGSEILPIYTCVKCGNMMWGVERPSIEDLNKLNEKEQVCEN